jgi:hypothetical protein
MKTYEGVDVQTHVFLISALVGGERSALRPGRFTPGERTPGTHWIGGWKGPRNGMHEMEKRKFCSCLYNFFKFFFKGMRYLMIYYSKLSVNEIGIGIILWW